MKSRDELQQFAQELFDKELSQEIIEQIDKDYQDSLQSDQSQSQSYPSTEMKVLSFKTLWLGNRFYNNLETGHFVGDCQISVSDGSQNFKFTQNTDKPKFGYKPATQDTIIPETINFNGGSIPNFLQVFKKLSPTYYIRAYLIHDWIFDCHQNNKKPVCDIPFEETAIILAEAIKVTMEEHNEPDEDILYLIYLAVRSKIAKNIWAKSS